MTTQRLETEITSPDSYLDSDRCPFCGGCGAEVWMKAPDRFNGRTEQYNLHRCSSCSLVWLAHPPSKLEMGEHYGPEYDQTIASAAKSPAHWLPRRDELLRYKSGGSILDLGCASGGFLSTLKGPSWKLFGIEMSEDAARSARARCDAEVFVGDILDAPFASASFDAITCFNVFEHLYEPVKVLERVSDWLKPNGIFYTMMPNIDSAGARIFGSYWYALELPRHLFHYSPLTLRTIAKSVGLQEVFIRCDRDLYFERSVGYVRDEIAKKIGLKRPPAAKLVEPGIPWKVVRKGFRVALLPLISAAASAVGDGEMMSAVFKGSRAP
jgi:SAM-dependent methyltransferase